MPAEDRMSAVSPCRRAPKPPLRAASRPPVRAYPRLSAQVADGPHRLAAHVAGQDVDVDAAVQVPALVLEAAGEVAGALDADGPALDVHALDHGVRGARRVEPETGHGQAPLRGDEGLTAGADEPRVDDVADVAAALVVLAVVHEHAEADADLVGREPGAVLLVHGDEHVVDEAFQRGVERPDGVALGAQDRVSEEADGAGGSAARMDPLAHPHDPINAGPCSGKGDCSGRGDWAGKGD